MDVGLNQGFMIRSGPQANTNVLDLHGVGGLIPAQSRHSRLPYRINLL